MDKIEYEGGITNLQELRGFVKSLPNDMMRKKFKKYLIEERNNSFFSQEDIELMFISDNWDELEKIGWLTEC